MPKGFFNVLQGKLCDKAGFGAKTKTRAGFGSGAEMFGMAAANVNVSPGGTTIVNKLNQADLEGFLAEGILSMIDMVYVYTVHFLCVRRNDQADDTGY